jgi:sulfur-carrier protein
MKVEVKFFTSLREITGKKVDRIQLQDAITVNELVKMLSEKYGKKFREYIYDKDGLTQEFLSFLVNGKNINKMQGFDTKLEDQDVIAILPPVGGG